MLNARLSKRREQRLVERSSPAYSMNRSLVFIACSEALYEGLASECENDGDRAEVIGKISARDNCNGSR